VNLLRAKALEPMLPWFAGAATDDTLPAAVRGIARTQLLDAMYTVELVRALSNGTKGAADE
jgi:hypothetical protein